MTEVDYDGGGNRTRLKDQLINLCVLGCPLSGNVVISKNFLRTRKIMMMHSDERGECCPRTLVDRKRKRYDNVVDVVVHLHDRPILVPNLVRHLHDLHTFCSVMSHELMIQ